MKIGHAKTANIRITNRNCIMQEPMEFLPLQKTVGSMDGGSTIQHYTNICFQVPGHGQNHVFALTKHNPQLQQAFVAQYPVHANIAAVAIGETPPNFALMLEGYRHL